mmetsp:Transcript_36473/g.66826  ORF Transcript_36473/g.66826 Transcript_36473/m.66826 type:complete len:651 (+) Transcript_36473:106-2058(+)
MWHSLGAHDTPERRAAIKRQQAAMLQEQIAEQKKHRDAMREREKEMERQELERDKKRAAIEAARLVKEKEDEAARMAANERRLAAASMSPRPPYDADDPAKPIRRSGNRPQIDIDAEWASWEARHGKGKAAVRPEKGAVAAFAEGGGACSTAPVPAKSASAPKAMVPAPAASPYAPAPPTLLSQDDGVPRLHLGQDLQRLRQACAEQRAGLRKQADHFRAEASKLAAEDVRLPMLAAQLATSAPKSLDTSQSQLLSKGALYERRAFSQQPRFRTSGYGLELSRPLAGWLIPPLRQPADSGGKAVQLESLRHAEWSKPALGSAGIASVSPSKGTAQARGTSLSAAGASGPAGSSGRGMLTLEQESVLLFPGDPLAALASFKAAAPPADRKDPPASSLHYSRANAVDLSKFNASHTQSHRHTTPNTTRAGARSAGDVTAAGTELSMSLNSLAYSRTQSGDLMHGAPHSARQPSRASKVSSRSPPSDTQAFDKVVNLGAALRSITLPPGVTSADGVDEDPRPSTSGSWPPSLRRSKTPKLSSVLAGEVTGNNMGGSDLGRATSSASEKGSQDMATLLAPPAKQLDNESTPKSPGIPHSPGKQSEQELLLSALNMGDQEGHIDKGQEQVERTLHKQQGDEEGSSTQKQSSTETA